jgi:hypothetical protein
MDALHWQVDMKILNSWMVGSFLGALSMIISVEGKVVNKIHNEKKLLRSYSTEKTVAPITGMVTNSMEQNFANLRHRFTFTGHSANDMTREAVSWPAPPPEFECTGEYAAAGFHNGLGHSSSASGNDDHAACVPCRMIGLTVGQKSAVWTFRQTYQTLSNPADINSWVDIPNEYWEINRSISRVGNSLECFISKRGVGTAISGEPAAFSMTVTIDNWFA